MAKQRLIDVAVAMMRRLEPPKVRVESTTLRVTAIITFPSLGYVVLQPLRWCCVDCVIHHERDVREEQHQSYMWREQAIIE